MRSFEQKAEAQISEVNMKLQESREKVSQLSAQVFDLQNEIKKLKRQLEEKQGEEEKLVDFNSDFIINAQEEMEVLQGLFIDLISEFSKTPAHKMDARFVNKTKTQAMNIVAEASKNISEYRSDKFPPNLKR